MQTLLRARRKKAKVSGASVAKEAGIDRSYYRYIEIGKFVPSPGVATRIAAVINRLHGSEVITASDIIFENFNRRSKARKAAA